MGCQQSKSATQIKRAPTSPMSATSWSNISIPREIMKISNPGERLFQLLSSNKKNSNVWAQTIKLCEKSPKSVLYQDPHSLDTPLHLACRLVAITAASNDNSDATPLDAVRVMIRFSADVASLNKKGYPPLHDAVQPIRNRSNIMTSIHNQAELVHFLIAADYDASLEYLSRSDVRFKSSNVEYQCTPLYHVIANLPDDFVSAPGPTVHLASTIHFPNPSMASTKNLSNFDKPLALLYRRFSRQFDLSEKFFDGDNSRKEVVEHRQMFKMAAMNTWKIILALLDPITDKKKSVHDFYMVHAAVRNECPQDLLRYIIETRPEEVKQVNEKGMLPLHVAANAGPHAPESSYHYKFVIDELLYSYPDGAAVSDKYGRLPLQLAIESGKKWIGGGTKSLHDVYPDAMARVNVDEFPSIKRALSFSTNFVGDMDSTEETVVTNGENGIVKEEHYDAIMMVQKSDVSLGDVVSIMWANEEDGGVQMLGCVAIITLAKRCQNDRNSLRDIGMTAVNTIVNAMKNHPNEVAVQEKGCYALCLVSPSDGYREVSYAASGAIASIVGAMQAHINDGIVQKEACAALSKILIESAEYGNSDRATVIASVSGITAIQNAIGAHPDNDDVQHEASQALETLSSFPDANLPN